MPQVPPPRAQSGLPERHRPPVPRRLSTVGQSDNLDDVAVQRSEVVPEAWIGDSAHGQDSTGSNNGVLSRYGYHWWVTTADDEAAY